MGRAAKQRRTRNTSDRSLEELDGERWREPTLDSYVVRTCHALRRKPINTLTDEELRLAVGQGMGLEWLVPLMLQRLTENPFRAGDSYEGDLLASLASVPTVYWIEHPTEKGVLANEVIPAVAADERLPDMSEEIQRAISQLRIASQ